MKQSTAATEKHHELLRSHNILAFCHDPAHVEPSQAFPPLPWPPQSHSFSRATLLALFFFNTQVSVPLSHAEGVCSGRMAIRTGWHLHEAFEFADKHALPLLLWCSQAEVAGTRVLPTLTLARLRLLRRWII